MKEPLLYPLKFTPIYKTTLWGGTKIAQFKGAAFLGKNLSNKNKIGESWEIAQVGMDASRVSNGSFKGLSLSYLLQHYGKAILGEPLWSRYGPRFPLLVKWIDAQDDLSVQVHPDNKMAARYHGLGKSEMWYVVAAEKGASLLAGLSPKATPEELNQAIEKGSFEGIINRYEVHAGDLFYLPAGCVHAIGKGIFLLEVQQSSDLTFRLFDYNRKDAHGELRPLHIAQAREALNFELKESPKISYLPPKEGKTQLISSPFFQIESYRLEHPWQEDLSKQDSFSLFCCTAGEGILQTQGDRETLIAQGETLLLPAITNQLRIVPKNSIELIKASI